MNLCNKTMVPPAV